MLLNYRLLQDGLEITRARSINALAGMCTLVLGDKFMLGNVSV